MKASVLVLALGLIVHLSMNAQTQPPTNHGDYLFAAKGSTRLTFFTGEPYIALAEVAYGVTDNFSVGLIAGVTPKVPAYGVRMSGRLYENDAQDFRITLRAPTFYYPETRDLGGEPWFLIYPVMAAEWKLESGVRVSAEAGVIAAMCAHALYMSLGIHRMQHEDMDDMGFVGGVWNTIGGGVAVPLSEQLTFQSQVELVLSGLGFADSSSPVEVPVMIHLGLTYAL